MFWSTEFSLELFVLLLVFRVSFFGDENSMAGRRLGDIKMWILGWYTFEKIPVAAKGKKASVVTSLEASSVVGAYSESGVFRRRGGLSWPRP